ASRTATLSELLQNKSRLQRRHILGLIREGTSLQTLVARHNSATKAVGSMHIKEANETGQFGEWSIRRTWMQRKYHPRETAAHKRHKQLAHEQIVQEQMFIDQFVAGKYRELEVVLSQADGSCLL